MTTKQFNIQGMTCNHCVMSVRKAIEQLPGVTSNDVKIGAALVSFDEHRVNEQQIRSAITEAGYYVVA